MHISEDIWIILLLLLLFSHWVMSNSLQLYELQHARLPCPSPSPRVCSNSCPLSHQCHLTISSSVTSFSSCPQSFPASESFSVSRVSASGGQSIGALASVLPANIHSCFPLGLTGLISLLRNSLESSPAPPFESSFSLWLNFDWLSF